MEELFHMSVSASIVVTTRADGIVAGPRCESSILTGTTRCSSETVLPPPTRPRETSGRSAGQHAESSNVLELAYRRSACSSACDLTSRASFKIFRFNNFRQGSTTRFRISSSVSIYLFFICINPPLAQYILISSSSFSLPGPQGLHTALTRAS